MFVGFLHYPSVLERFRVEHRASRRSEIAWHPSESLTTPGDLLFFLDQMRAAFPLSASLQRIVHPRIHQACVMRLE